MRSFLSRPLGVAAGPSAACLVLSLAACSAPDLVEGGGNGGGETELPDGTTSSSLLPARIRRLTNAEYNASVAALLGTTSAPAVDFTPDARQHGYTVNEAQRVDPILARQLDAAAIKLAAEAKTRLDELAPCADPVAGGEACADAFVRSFGAKAYRRPLVQEDVDGLLGLYRVGAEGATYADGIEHLLRGILQSPGFLYHTEIGTGSHGDGKALVELTPHELAESLAYLITGGPPDPELLGAAEGGDLGTAEGRAAQVRRLFQSSLGSSRNVRLIREWLGIDRIANTAKDSNVYPDYAGLKDAIERETESFVTNVLSTSSGSVADFLGAPSTTAEPALLEMYQRGGSSQRIGLLNQAAFLSVYAHAHETAPVLRGVAMMRRVACVDIELPTTLDVVIIPPVPDPTKTTRERFSIHAEDKACASCHRMIDPLGFSFEQFDGMGKFRATENGTRLEDGSTLDDGIPVDSATTVALNLDFDGAYTDSNALATAVAGSAHVRECFARQMFRASAAEGHDVDDAEETFLALWKELPEETRGSLLETLVAFAESSLFTHRRAQ